MARDQQAPVDPNLSQPRSIDPSRARPGAPRPPDRSDLDGGDYAYWLHEGVTPFRSSPDGHDFEAWSENDDAWMIQNSFDPTTMRPTSAGVIAGMIGGGRQRLTEPSKGALPAYPGPDEDYAPVEPPDWINEADSTGDLPDDGTGDGPPGDDGTPQATLDDLPDGGMNEQQIRDAGLRIDVPYEVPMPVALKYKDTGQQAWTPPPGWRGGAPPIDAQLAASMGVPRDLGDAQEGAEGGGTSGGSGQPGT